MGKKKKKSILTIPALEITQGPKRRLYSFAVDGKSLPDFATVSRIRRGQDTSISGYQRPEVLSHIAEIKRYIESSDAMLPNALVIAFDERVKFKPFAKSKIPKEACSEYVRPGRLLIPIEDDTDSEDKPGWIVDGQQRAAALREAAVASFPICVTAFITGSVEEQRAQFILVNSTKPLPKGLIYELLPSTEGELPLALERRRFPALLLERLNFDDKSPLQGRIRTPTCPDGVIKDNSILKMVEISLHEGALYRYRDPDSGEGNVEEMLALLKNFWTAVSQVWETAWNSKPRNSRLVHGAGIVSLGLLMDSITFRYRETGRVPSAADYTRDLRALKPACHWTEGHWEFGEGQQRKWNELQNTSKDIQLLANYLLIKYRKLVLEPQRRGQAGQQKRRS